MLLGMTADQIHLPDAPAIPGLAFRLFRDESDYAHIVELINTCSVADGVEDHVWSHSDMTDVDYERWTHDPNFQPQLWQVAWAGDEVGGMVLNFIDHQYNEEFKRLRGWTDPIGVRRPWRKQGLAKALIARSMRLLQEQGMSEAGLGVDAQNPNGALRLYESLGFRAMKRFTTFERPMDKKVWAVV